MNQYLTREQIRLYDRNAIENLKVPGVVLMENAGRSCAETALKMLSSDKVGRVVVVCGGGNNGGDGFVIARHLILAGHDVVIAILVESATIKSDALTNLTILKNMKADIRYIDSANQLSELLSGVDLIVDGILGTGFNGRLRENILEFINVINANPASTLSVDVPSGLDCNSGTASDGAVVADCTVTFVAPKTGFSSVEAQRYLGEIVVSGIGA